MRSLFRAPLWALLLGACSSPAPDLETGSQAIVGDNDDDGVSDTADLDDDNDGVLDQTECPAQTLAGSAFWLTFNPNGGWDVPRNEVHVAGAPGTLVTIGPDAPRAIPASGFLSVTDRPVTELTAGVVQSGRALRITASGPIQLFGNNFLDYSVDAFTALPDTLLGTEYYALGYPNSLGASYPAQITVTATEPDTSVTIGGGSAITLQTGQTYLYTTGADATGTKIAATKPVVVNSGTSCLNTGGGACDHVEEVLFPVEGWASEYFVPALPQPQNYRIVAATAGTTVTVNGTLVATIGAGQYYQGSGGGAHVVTSQPTEAFIIALGTSEPTGDPAFVLLPGAQNGVGSATFGALSADNANYAVIALPTAAIPSLRLDGATVSATFTAFPGTTYSHGYVPVTFGAHTLTADQAFIPVAWGEKDYESYGYVAGYGFPQTPGVCTTDTDGDTVVDSFDHDSDGDGISDVDEAGGVDTNHDGIADGSINPDGIPTTAGTGTTPTDTDGDGTPDPQDLDSDDDGVDDDTDSKPLIATECRDVDADTCDDCSVTGANKSGGSVTNDGPDTDGDGACNAGDNDADNDGVDDEGDSAPTNPLICKDADADGCDDCSGTGANGSGGSITSDGVDTDGDGACNTGDADDDGDGQPDLSDAFPLDQARCADGDDDGCDDCAISGASGGGAQPATDGIDTDADGACNAGDGDDDGDGVADGSDASPLDPARCADGDADGCDDCAISGASGGGAQPATDGLDTDTDGACNVGDPDDDNDGVADGADVASLNPLRCRDVDADTCDDCTAGAGPAPAMDGLDTDIDGACNVGDPDDDGDGVADGADVAGLDPLRCSDTDADQCDDCSAGEGAQVAFDGTDTDADGACNTGDTDDDGDGVPDGSDGSPLDQGRCADTDADGCDDCAVTGLTGAGASVSNDGTDTDADGACNTGDADDDNDGVPDAGDANPTDGARCADADADGCDDCAVTGATGAGAAPGNDGLDTDLDGACNVGDTDDDDDGRLDTEDSATLVPFICADTDEDSCDDCTLGSFAPSADGADTDTDGQCDAGDGDDDGDGVIDAEDNCPLVANASQLDTDTDGTGDACQGDDDGDGDLDGADNCPLVANADQLDTDGDLAGDACDSDDDDDGDLDGADNCPLIANADQADADGDDTGDACGDDDDGDGDLDGADNCPLVANADQLDTDGDGTGDACTDDDDGDGDLDGADNCPLLANADQLDTNSDGTGDACSDDDDGDGDADGADNCPQVANADQLDSDEDGAGDVCDETPHRDGQDAIEETSVGGGGCSAGGGGASGPLGLLLLGAALLVPRRRRRAAQVAAVAASTLGAVIVAAPAVASAQAVEASAFPVDRFRTAIDAQGILGAEWAEVPRHLAWDLGVWVGAVDDPLVSYDATEARVLDLVHRRVTSTVTGSLALHDRVQLGLEMPLILSQSRATGQTDTMLGSISGASLGDLRLVAKIALLQQQRHGFSLALIPALTVPTAGGDEYRGDGSVTFAPELAASRSLGQLRLAGNLGYRLRENTSLSDLAVGDELFARVAAGYRVVPRVEVDLGLATAAAASSPYGSSNQSYAEALGGVTVAVPVGAPGALSVGAVGGLGLTTGFGSPDWRAVLTLRYEGARPATGPVTHAVVAEPTPPVVAPVDTDGDGIVDDADRCPAEAGVADQAGCPVPAVIPPADTDGDGIADADDRCPAEAGVAEHQGCQPPPAVVVAQSSLEIRESVQFGTNDATIAASSHELLRSVAKVLTEHPEVTGIEVAGHTDDKGGEAFNRTLSQRRADAVVAFLVAEGVAKDRLIARGYGEARPLEPSTSDEARARNRRVEFVITARSPAATTP